MEVELDPFANLLKDQDAGMPDEVPFDDSSDFPKLRDNIVFILISLIKVKMIIIDL